MVGTRSKADIEAEIAAARARLVGNIEGLIGAVHPQAVKTRAINDAKDFAVQEINAVRSKFVDAMGEVQWGKVAKVGAAVVGAIVVFSLLKGRRK